MAWQFAEDGETVERECLLFEAGSYPDKGVTITEDDLREIAANSAAAIPVKIEHLAESPFDGALGMVTRLRVAGGQLWGTLRQPIEAWRFVQRAGAKALSVALDVAARRLVETSFVCHPRVAGAQVFREAGVVAFRTRRLFTETEGAMTGVRQLVEGLIGYLRGFPVGEEPETTAQFAAALEAERTARREEQAARQLLDWKRGGLIRATERTESLARTLLTQGAGSVVMFDGERTPVSAVFAAFVEANGAVIPMGERMAADRSAGAGSASARLIALTRETAAREGVGYAQAFAAVTAANPGLAREAREE